MMGTTFKLVKNIVGKGEYADYFFFRLPTVFLKALISQDC